MEDMFLTYKKELTIDRINVNGNYEPSNCRWATRKEQGRNKRTNKIIEYNGIKKPIIEWAEDVGLKNGTLWYRIKHGWDIENALNPKLVK